MPKAMALASGLKRVPPPQALLERSSGVPGAAWAVQLRQEGAGVASEGAYSNHEGSYPKHKSVEKAGQRANLQTFWGTTCTNCCICNNEAHLSQRICPTLAGSAETCRHLTSGIYPSCKADCL